MAAHALSPLYVAFEAPDEYGRDALLGRILSENLPVECLYPDKKIPAWQASATELMGQAKAAVVLLSRQAEGVPGLAWEMQQLSARNMPVLRVQVHAGPEHQMRNVSGVPWDWEAIRRFLAAA